MAAVKGPVGKAAEADGGAEIEVGAPLAGVVVGVLFGADEDVSVAVAVDVAGGGDGRAVAGAALTAAGGPEGPGADAAGRAVEEHGDAFAIDG